MKAKEERFLCWHQNNELNVKPDASHDEQIQDQAGSQLKGFGAKSNTPPVQYLILNDIYISRMTAMFTQPTSR